MNNNGIREWPPAYEKPEGKYVFISYSHKDADLVYRDLKELHDNGARFWYDKAMREGQDWLARATARIRDPNCCEVLFYVTKNALQSEAILKELELVKERRKRDPEFTFASINIPGETAFQMMKSLDIPEKTFRSFLEAFPEEKLFFPRTEDGAERKHLYSLVAELEKVDAIDMSQCKLSQIQLFKYREYKHGAEIKKYIGGESVVYIPPEIEKEKVISIGIEAFQGNKELKQVVIPEGVERIDDFAFSGCSNLEKVTLPVSLQSLGYEAFRDCSKLKSIEIPRKVGLIGDYCFYRCHSLKELNLLSEVPLTLAFAAFSECQAMEELTLPDSTVSIGPYVFNNCISLKRITIPQKVKSIGLSAFYSCTSLEEVSIQSKEFMRNNKWFSRCRNLERIIFRYDIMGHYATDEGWKKDHGAQLCYKLEAPQGIECPADLISWEASPGAERYVVCLNGKTFETEECCLSIPVKEVSNRYEISVKACSAARSLIDSEFSVEHQIEVNREIFKTVSTDENIILLKYSGKETVVEIPDEITIIADEAFFNHEELQQVKFPSKLHTIGQKAFYHCTGLKKLNLPSSLTTIGKEAFWGTAIRRLKIPRGVKSIGDGCFAGCNDLKTLRIDPEGLEYGGDKIFYRCINLRTVCFNSKFSTLYSGMFRGCTELEEITLPGKLKTICSGAISYIMRLTEINIPASVTEIASGAFSNSFGLEKILVDKRNEVYMEREGVLFHKNSDLDHTIIQFPSYKPVDSYEIAEDVSSIGKLAFKDAEHLKEVTIVGDMKEIGESAFERCPNLREVTVQGKLEHIQKDAFKDCFKLRWLHLKSDTPPKLYGDPFENVPEDMIIYVPQEYIDHYTRVSEWQYVQRRLKPDSEM